MTSMVHEDAIAIIGMVGRFPLAENLEQYWQNLVTGRECISLFSDEALLSAGYSPDLLADSNFVPAAGLLTDTDLFDADFFGFSAREAEILDPQQRIFLECAWTVLEKAGYNPEGFDGRIGVYAGSSMSSYLITNLYSNRDLVWTIGPFQMMLANDKDYLTTRTAYKLNLHGPGVNINTACSTSLVAIHMACQAILNGECEIALAGGVTIDPQAAGGYLYETGGIMSPDGHCRAFDAQAQGTVRGNGVGIVALKLLGDALADGDVIQAVIRGSAINNDGADKVGFTAPSVDGQAEVIMDALAMAQVSPETVSYVEAHGTGTPLGDPIEIMALTQAFRSGTERTGFCAIGSAKTNIGHLDSAAGVAGLIKAALALKHKQLPPSLHFEAPNPKIDFVNSPFFVNHALQPWVVEAGPRRAGVSSFGIGGTNAHVVLEEAPALVLSGPSRRWQLLLWSGRTETAVDTIGQNLQAYLTGTEASWPLADVAYTLQVGRKRFAHRRMLVCGDRADALTALNDEQLGRIWQGVDENQERPVAFLFPGQGAQYAGMAWGLYESEPVFRDVVDDCCDLLRPQLGLDLRHVLFPGKLGPDTGHDLQQTWLTQPAVFVVSYALAQLWLTWGVEPQAMIGHSIGEYVAACLAGVFSLEEALALLALRGRLMQALPSGRMLAVSLSEADLMTVLEATVFQSSLSLAAVNGPTSCVVAGPEAVIEACQAFLEGQGVTCRLLYTSHAFHSMMMASVVPTFVEAVGRLDLQRPQRPYLSNVTGNWIEADEAIDPAYWGRHLRQTVRFADGVKQLMDMGEVVLLEVGPGRTLGSLARQQDKQQTILTSLRHPKEDVDDVAYVLGALGQLWLAGVAIDWQGFYKAEQRQRVVLPTYPFERQRYWIEPKWSSNGKNGQMPEVAEAMTVAETSSALASSHTRPNLPTPYVAPSTELETAVVTMCQTLLGYEPIGIHDDFFALGGDSLIATRLMTRLRQVLEVDIPMAHFFEQPTVAALTAMVVEARGEMVTVAIPPRPDKGIAPLSYAQQRLWFLHQLAPEASAYNLSTPVQLEGTLDVAVLRQALAALVERHETLRTTFETINGSLQQVIQARLADVPLFVETLPDEAAVRQAALQAVKRPFDLAQEFAWRAHVYQLDTQTHVLLIVIHHIIADGWSFGVLFQELAAFYTAFKEEQPTRLPALPVQYADFAHWQQQQDDLLAEQLRYWQTELQAPRATLDMPTDYTRPAVQTFAGEQQQKVLPLVLSEAVKALAQQEKVTPFMLLMGVFHILLHRYTGETDILVGTPVAGRRQSEVEGLIGCFINTLVIRSRVTPEMTSQALWQQVKATSLRAFENQDLPFEKLVAEIQPERDTSRSPIFQIMFAYQNTPAGRGRFGDLNLAPFALPSEAAIFDIWLSVWDSAAGLVTKLEYNRDLFEAATMERLLAHYEMLLEAVVTDVRQPVSLLPMMTMREQNRLAAWNETGQLYQTDGCLLDLFEMQAIQNPQALAVSSGDVQLSYTALNARANQLAHYLGEQGVTPRSLVGVCLGRSVDMLIGLLGVLKTGAAYVPIDPAYPAERITYVMQDAGLAFVLTQESLLTTLPVAAGVQLICVDREWSYIKTKSSFGLGRSILPDDVAYVIYTSGSTGKPKGVQIPHQCVG